MSQSKCIKCGRDNPEYSYDYITVYRKSESNTYSTGSRIITKTLTTEGIVGTYHGCVCDECVRKRRLTHSLALGGIGFVLGFVILVLFTISGGFYWMEALGCGVIFGGILFALGMRKKTSDLSRWIIRDSRKIKDIGYVSVDRNEYIDKHTGQPTLERFKNETVLKTDVAEKLFKLICCGDTSDPELVQLLEQTKAFRE